MERSSFSPIEGHTTAQKVHVIITRCYRSTARGCLGAELRSGHAHGADDVSFEAIVASGPNGALPHATPTDKIVEPRTLVVVDWGVKAGGYCSDCTRTLSTGSPPAAPAWLGCACLFRISRRRCCR